MHQTIPYGVDNNKIIHVSVNLFSLHGSVLTRNIIQNYIHPELCFPASCKPYSF